MEDFWQMAIYKLLWLISANSGPTWFTLNLHWTHTDHTRVLPKQQQKSPDDSAFCTFYYDRCRHEYSEVCHLQNMGKLNEVVVLLQSVSIKEHSKRQGTHMLPEQTTGGSAYL